MIKVVGNEICRNKELKAIYKCFFIKSNVDFLTEEYVEHTEWKGIDSKSSLSFKDEKSIEEVFELSNKERFIEKSSNAELRIKVLHSSALLPLLVLYNVSNENNLVIKIGEDNVVFDEVYFEVQNKAFASGYPSKVDVALVSKKSEIVLYVESKFTEYLSGNVSNKFSNKYEEIVKRVLGDKYEKCSDGRLKIKDYTYGEGVKQLIAHFVGICKGAVNRKNEADKYVKEGYKVCLAELLFKFDKVLDKGRFEKYSKQYEAISRKLNDIYESCENHTGAGCNCNEIDSNIMISNAPKNFEVLPKLLTYQGILKDSPGFKVDEMVRKYYQL